MFLKFLQGFSVFEASSGFSLGFLRCFSVGCDSSGLSRVYIGSLGLFSFRASRGFWG